MKARTTGTWAVIAVAMAATVVFVLLRSAAVEATYPIERFAGAFRHHVWSRVTGAFSGARARAENVRLRRQVAALALSRAELDRLEGENARLRAAVGFASAPSGGWLGAVVLSEGGASAGARRAVRVGRGSLDGVAVGAAVAVPEGVVGQVTSVTPHTAEVALLTDGGTRVPCEVECVEAVRPRGIVAGGDGEFLEMRYLRRFVAAPTPRARVVTSGLGGTYPRGLEVGVWIEFATNRENVVYGRVLPSVDFEALEDVFIRCEK